MIEKKLFYNFSKNADKVNKIFVDVVEAGIAETNFLG